MTTAMEAYVSAAGKLYRERENYLHERAHDVANELTLNEADITLKVLQVEEGIISGDSLSPEEQEVVRYHLISETREVD